MISYAQNREDEILSEFFPGRDKGFYIDVGSWHPVECSITKHFYDHGWWGINIEPSFGKWLDFCSVRKNDINLNVGLSNHLGKSVFYEGCNGEGLSTFERDVMLEHLKAGFKFSNYLVNTLTLAKICESFVRDKEIDFISIDVEGHEKAVIEGGDWERWRPYVLVIEATKPLTTIPSYEDWEPLLLESNYQFVRFDGLNRYYVRGD